MSASQFPLDPIHWDNRCTAPRWWNTERPLTRSSGYSREGLAMKPTQNQENPDTFTYTVDSDGCWIWGGYVAANGYARIYDRKAKRIVWAHRYSYERHVEAIRPGYEIDHMCQVTACVNPAHLQQLTHREHVRVTMKRLGKDDLHIAAATLRETGATYAEIADALGYAGKEGARGAVMTAIRNGLVDPDDIPRPTRLSEVERQEVIDLVALGIPQGVVAELFEIHSSQVSRVSRGIRSGHPKRAA